MPNPPSNIVQYGTFSLDDAIEERQAVDAISSSKFHKFSAGKNKIRILPPKLGQKPFVKVFQHFVKIGGMESSLVFNCPRKMANQPCLVCNDSEHLGATGSSVDYELAGRLFAGFRVYFNAIDRAHPETGPVVCAVGKKIYEAILDIRKDEEDGGNFLDPEEGFDIIIEKIGEMKNTKYAVRSSQKGSTPLGDMTWIEVQSDLSRLARVPNQEELKDLIENTGYVKESATLQLGRGGASRSPGPRKAGGRSVAADVGDDD